MLWLRQPIEKALLDPAHPESVRSLLEIVDPVREFARSLGLDVDDQYTSYVDWPGDRIVTTLVRTRPDSLELVPWWFPVLGELPYKGFFDRERAEREAARLAEDGEYQVCVSGIAAYSTLGWLDDPVTRPMLLRGAGALVETLLHELVHATAFLPGDADFNEGVAQFIGQEAAVAFFASADDKRSPRPRAEEAEPPALPSPERVRDSIQDRRLLSEAMLVFKDEVALLEGVPDRAERRAAAEANARQALGNLPLRVLDAERIAAAARLSDACLALRGTYTRDLPRHARVLEFLGGDLSAMIERLREWADESRPSETFFVDAPTDDPPGFETVPEDVSTQGR